MSSLARPPGVHVTLSAEGQLLAKEQVFRGQGRPGPEAAPQEPQDVDPERNTGPTQMDQRLNISPDWRGSLLLAGTQLYTVEAEPRRGAADGEDGCFGGP